MHIVPDCRQSHLLGKSFGTKDGMEKKSSQANQQGRLFTSLYTFFPDF
jgi:hypothetical protein